MSGSVVALVAGTVLAVGALAFVLYPLFFAISEHPRGQDPQAGNADDSAILALREIEFDRATGKLSEADYAELKRTYSGLALTELRGAKEAVNAQPLDPIEARVLAYRMTHRECPTCGLRPEPNAIYCSTCGGYLERVCPVCKAEITEQSAAFCSTCGATLSVRRSRAAAARS
jgi:predicted nucleic acid-binding Zn ribbon protein